jgi:hypothetical protein
MKAFISHNKADKEHARTLAGLLIEQGEGVWFDEWDLRPGDSLTGGIEEGLDSSDVFILIWSDAARRSEWVGTELRATIRRRVDDASLRIVPVMLDQTPLPRLVADFLGFDLSSGDVAQQVTGQPRDIQIAQRLQARLQSLAVANVHPSDPFGLLICPSCGSGDLKRTSATDDRRDETYYLINCDCGWGDWTQ